MNLNLDFLAHLPPALPDREAPVNVYNILRDGFRESRVDMTLQFFFDPTERHQFGSLVIDAFLRTLDGASLIAPTGPRETAFDASDFLGTDTWEISTQVDYIDLLLVNEEFDLGIVVENKIGHHLNNPLQNYATHAFKKDVSQVLVVVLAPEKRTHTDPVENRWLSKSVTYEELFDAIKRSPEFIDFLLNPLDADQRRSVDLLQQFMEARTQGTHMDNLKNEEELLTKLIDLLNENEAMIQEYEARKHTANRLLRQRMRRLEDLLEQRLSEESLKTGWEAHSGRPGEYWNAYDFPEINRSIELKFASKPGLSLIYIYDRPSGRYDDGDQWPLDVAWSASDDEIAEAFIQTVKDIHQREQGTQTHT